MFDTIRNLHHDLKAYLKHLAEDQPRLLQNILSAPACIDWTIFFLLSWYAAVFGLIYLDYLIRCRSPIDLDLLEVLALAMYFSTDLGRAIRWSLRACAALLTINSLLETGFLHTATMVLVACIVHEAPGFTWAMIKLFFELYFMIVLGLVDPVIGLIMRAYLYLDD